MEGLFCSSGHSLTCSSSARTPPAHWHCVMMLMKRFADELGVNHLRGARSPRDAALLLASRFVRMLG